MDIDKMFLSMLNYKVTAGHARDYDFISDESEWHENRLIKDYIAMLLNKDKNGVPRNVQQLHGSIDKDTKLLTDTLKELESSGAFKERLTYQDYTLSNEVFIKQEFITGKNGIGPFALNNNNHILTMLYGVRFRKNKNSILTRLNLNRLDRTVDRDGKSILSWLSGLINAHVDIAKDPYISRLGVNPFTYNMTNLLIRTGLGKYTFYFLTQPLLMELAEVYTNAGGVYGVDRTKTVSQLRKESRQRYIINYINSNLNTEFEEYEYKEAIQAWKETMDNRKININQAIDYLFNSKVNILKDVSRQYKSTGNKVGANDNDQRNITIETKSGHQMVSMFDLQMLVYSAFEQFEPSAQALANVVKYSKIDTKKQGKNITEQRAYAQGVYNTFVDVRGTRRLFNNGLYKMYSQSYIKEKTDLALSAFSDIMSVQMLQATEQFNRQLHTILNILNKYGDRLNEEIIGSVSDAMIQQIKSRYINDYAKRHNIDIKGLVSGDNTIFDRLVNLQIAIKTQDKYKDLLLDGEIQNYLLRSLVTALNKTIQQSAITDSNGQEDTYKNAKFVKLLNFLEEDQMDSDQLRSDWQQLLDDGTYPELQEFARDLIVYSFITTGDVGGGMKNLFKFVPNSWKLDNSDGNESYNEYMDRVSFAYKQGTAGDIDIQDLVLNNWRDYNFVPTYTMRRKGGFRFQSYFPEGFDYPIILSGITTTEDGDILPTFNEDPDSETYYPSPKYLKIARNNEDIDESSQRIFNIYKRVAFGQYTTESGETIQYPIYVLVGPKGNTFEGNYKILEYDREDQSYKELANAVAKDPLIKTLLKYTEQEYTDVESLLNILSNTLSVGDQVLQIYNQATGKNIVFDDALRFILTGYREHELMLTDGGMVIHAQYSRSTAKEDIQNLYIFTDNTDRTSGNTPVDDNSWYAEKYSNGKQLFYPSVTTAQIRGLENAYPISTQHYFNDEKKGSSGRWNDADYDEVVRTVEQELSQIQQAWESGKYKNIILPAGDGFVNANISQINETRTPKLFKYFTEVENRIRAMVEQNVPLVDNESAVFEVPKTSLEDRLKDQFPNTEKVLDYFANQDNILAQKLLPYVKEHGVNVYFQHAGDEYIARYNPQQDAVFVNLDSDKAIRNLNEVLLHETLHSLTSKWLNEHEEDAAKIKILMNYAEQSLDKDIHDRLVEQHPNMFKNVKEFLTYATTNETLANELRKIEPMESNTFESLFKELIQNIKDIINKIIGKQDASVLDQVDAIVDQVLSKQYADDESEVSEDDSGDDIQYEHKKISVSSFTVSVNLGEFNNSSDIVGDILTAFNKDLPNNQMLQETVHGQIKKSPLFKVYRGQWMVNHRNEQFFLNGKSVSAFDYARYYLSKWLSDNNLPSNLLFISKGGAVFVDNYYTEQVYNSFYETSSYIDDFEQLGSELMRSCGY